MYRLDTEHPLFEELKKQPKWWRNLISDKDIYVKIRQENLIDIYYNDDYILKSLGYNDGNFSAEMNPQYLIPFEENISYNLVNGMPVFDKQNVEILYINTFLPTILAEMKKRIKVQSSFRNKVNRKYSRSKLSIDFNFETHDKNVPIIDWIFAYNETFSFSLTTTIDNLFLYEMTTDNNFMEIKRKIQDISDILLKCKLFVENHEEELREYFNRLFTIKKELGILSESFTKVKTLKNYTFQTRPYLEVLDMRGQWTNSMCDIYLKNLKEQGIVEQIIFRSARKYIYELS